MMKRLTACLLTLCLPQVEPVFDRPFLFAVTGPNGTVIFAGLVTDPSAGAR